MNRPAPLRSPLGTSFVDRLPEGRVHRLWQRIESARARRRVVIAYYGAAIAVAAVLAVVALWRPWSTGPGALHLAGGAEVPASIVASDLPDAAFDDGSRLLLAAGTRIDLLESNGRVFELAHRAGTAEFEVHPGGPRVWRIQCSDVTVEVVGTHFTIERAPRSLRVSVTRGAVVVRGERVPDKVVRLGAGQRITVPLGDEPARAPAPPVTARATTEGPAPPASAAAAPRRTARDSPLAVAQGEPPSEPQPAASVPTLDATLNDADNARREARFADAARLLEGAVGTYAADPRIALAEFSLGRLYLDSLGDAGRAASWFTRAIADGRLPGTLQEDAHARLVEALARGGDSSGANQAAARYRAAYPGGRRTADVERWVPSAR